MDVSKDTPQSKGPVATVIGTSPSGSAGLAVFAGIVWAVWIGFLAWILLTRT